MNSETFFWIGVVLMWFLVCAQILITRSSLRARNMYLAGIKSYDALEGRARTAIILGRIAVKAREKEDPEMDAAFLEMVIRFEKEDRVVTKNAELMDKAIEAAL